MYASKKMYFFPGYQSCNFMKNSINYKPILHYRIFHFTRFHLGGNLGDWSPGLPHTFEISRERGTHMTETRLRKTRKENYRNCWTTIVHRCENKEILCVAISFACTNWKWEIDIACTAIFSSAFATSSHPSLLFKWSLYIFEKNKLPSYFVTQKNIISPRN